MHHPRSNASASRLRTAALLLIGKYLLILTGLVLIAHAVWTGDKTATVGGLGMVGAGLVLLVAQWIAASGAGCPLCRTPVLAAMGCMKHRRARRFLGSHRLRVAMGIVLRNRFRCPYCNESTDMESRETLTGNGRDLRR